MSAPGQGLGHALGLEITLRVEHGPAHREHIAHLAGRLGFGAVWLPAGSGPPPVDGLRRLITAAAPARVGLMFDLTDTTLGWLAATRDGDALGELLVELPGSVSGEVAARLIESIGGAESFARRVRIDGELDLASAGHVVRGDERTAVLTRLAEARDARDASGRVAADFPVVVDVTVAIGRTMREAEVRAERDPLLAGARHPRSNGLFGTLEHAQDQVLAYARAGADVLRATLAEERDVADLLAQFRSLAVGPVPLFLSRRLKGPL